MIPLCDCLLLDLLWKHGLLRSLFRRRTDSRRRQLTNDIVNVFIMRPQSLGRKADGGVLGDRRRGSRAQGGTGADGPIEVGTEFEICVDGGQSREFSLVVDGLGGVSSDDVLVIPPQELAWLNLWQMMSLGEIEDRGSQDGPTDEVHKVVMGQIHCRPPDP